MTRGDAPAGPLVDAPELLARLARHEPVAVLDVRWRLGGPPGRGDHAAGHVPGAVFLDLDTDLAGPPGAGGRHPLPDPDALRRVLRSAGVRSGVPVVVYDAGDGAAAARAWWVLRWAGVRDVAVLDGGWPAWLAAGGASSTEPPHPAPGDVDVTPGGMPVLDADAAADLARSGVLLDARAAERYRGEREPVDPVAGHVPGALSAPTAEDTGPGGRLLPAAALRERYAALGVADGVRVGAYCGSGVAAARTVLALEVARPGAAPAALYVGSWSEWTTDPRRPVATGPPPVATGPPPVATGPLPGAAGRHAGLGREAP